MSTKPKEAWSSRLGVILAVSGSAVGLGNFLRFPGHAAEYGGGAFMIAYFLAFFLVGLPICWAEWTMGRASGQLGFNSSPAILTAIARHRNAKYLGVIGVVIPVVIYMYYVNIEAWCLGYAVNFLRGTMDFATPEEAGAWWQTFIGVGGDGEALGFGWEKVGGFLIFVFLLNFVLIYRGLAKGIELFCTYAMPTLVVLAFIILIRVLTLGAPDPERPDHSVLNGLGFMWNPTKTVLLEKQEWETVKTFTAEDQRAQSIATGEVMARPNQYRITAFIDWSEATVERLDENGIWRVIETVHGAQAVTDNRLWTLSRPGLRVVPTERAAEFALERKHEEPAWVKVGEVVGPSQIKGLETQLAGNDRYRLDPVTVMDQLRRPELWLAAAGQIFFSLSVGFGIILTYASYLSEKDDVVLSGLAATSANEFCEVGLGGLITLPAAVAFLGVAGVAGMGTFGLGFNVLPMVFASMPLGNLFGFVFFFLLFLAAVTSSLSMLQPGIAFLEEAMGINRRQSVAILGLITALGAAMVVYFSGAVKALDTLDFWAGTFLIYVFSTITIILFGWVLGIKKGFAESERGAMIRIPKFYGFIMKFITPAFLLVIFASWFIFEVLGLSLTGGEPQYSSYIVDLFIEPNAVAWMSVGMMLVIGIFAALVLSGSTFFRTLAANARRKFQ